MAKRIVEQLAFEPGESDALDPGMLDSRGRGLAGISRRRLLLEILREKEALSPFIIRDRQGVLVSIAF